MKVGVYRARLPLWEYKVAHSLFGLSMWNLFGVWGFAISCARVVLGYL